MRSKRVLLLACAIGLLNASPRAGAQDLLWQTLMDSANASIAQHNYKSAESQLSAALKAIETDPAADKKKDSAERIRTTLRTLATVYEAQAQYEHAEALLTKLLAMDEKSKDKSELLQDLNSIAIAHKHLHKHAEAEREFQRAISMAGSEHTTKLLMNLAMLYQEQGKYEQEETLLKKALGESAGTTGDTVIIMDALAKLYTLQNRFAEAEPLLQKSLTLKEKAAAKSTHQSLADLGKLYADQGKFDEAEKQLKQAIAISEGENGADSAKTAEAITHLADVYIIQEKTSDAIALYEKARTIIENKLGKDNANLAPILSRLAYAQLSIDKYEQAESLYKQALRIDETTHGAHSREAARERSNLALVYVNQGRYQDAEPLYKQALDDITAAVGVEHPDTATSMNNLALLYRNESNLAEAEVLLKKALAIRQKALGPDHPAVARNLSNLADIHLARFEYKQAEHLLRQALTIEERALESTHPDIAANLRALAAVLEAQKNWVEAEATYKQLVAYDNKAEVPDATLASDLDGVVRALHALGKKDEAEPLNSRSVTIKAKLPGMINFDNAVVQDPNSKGAFTPKCPVKDKWALVVGISNFQDPSMNLKFAAKDATDFKNYLVQEAHFQPDHVKLLTDKQATRQSIIDNLGDKWLKRLANPDDLVVIYLSTHGSSAKQEAGSANFIVPHDGNLENIVFNGIPMQWLTAGIKDLVHCDRIVLLLDVCHGGAVAEGGKGLRRAEIELNPQKIITGDGQIVVASSQADQISWESKQYANGVFTRRLLEGLRKNGDKTRLKDAYTYMREKVTEEVLRDRAHFQTPVLVTKWWQGDDIAIGILPTEPRPGLASTPVPATAIRDVNPGSKSLPKTPARTKKP